MQTQIQPKFNENTPVSCSCGNKFTTGSIKNEIVVEVCSNCHPFYTGEHKFLDTKGSVDKFLKREKDAIEYKKTRGSKKNKGQNKQEKKTKSLKELLGEI